jgi:hypothetical protein
MGRTRTTSVVVALVGAVVVASCAGTSPSSTEITTSSTENHPSTSAPPDPVAIDAPSVSISIPDAIALNVASNGVDDPVVAWTTESEVMVATLDVGAGALGDPVAVNADLAPFANPLERPAVAVGTGGEVTVAFIASSGMEGSVYLTTWDGTAAPTSPDRLSGEPTPETALVHVTLDPSGAPILSWLENSTLSVAVPQGAALPFEQTVDDLTCDCCHPVPTMVGEVPVVGYRDLVHTTGGVVRDVSVVVEESDGFSEPIQVADDHWYLDACPFSGPTMGTVDGDLVVAWMDARQSVHPDQDGSTIWVDRSSDGGRTFGTDRAITSGGTHRYPVMAVDAVGVVHLIWESIDPERGLIHAVSDDGGRSFGGVVMLVPADEDTGAPGFPSVITHDGLMIVTWTDRAGGHVAAWPLAAGV